MGFHNFRLKAGQPLHAAVQGKMVLVDDIVGAATVDITLVRSSTGVRLPGRKKAFKFWQDYDAVTLEAATDCTVSLFLTFSDVSLGFTDTVNVVGGVSILNSGDQRVPVDIAGAAITVTADNVGVNNTEANPVPVKLMPREQAVLSNAAVVVNTGAGQVVSNDADLIAVTFRNESPVAVVYLGALGVTAANAAVVLNPGDAWTDEAGASAAWYATSSQAGADLRVLGVK